MGLGVWIFNLGRVRAFLGCFSREFFRRYKQVQDSNLCFGCVFFRFFLCNETNMELPLLGGSPPPLQQQTKPICTPFFCIWGPFNNALHMVAWFWGVWRSVAAVIAASLQRIVEPIAKHMHAEANAAKPYWPMQEEHMQRPRLLNPAGVHSMQVCRYWWPILLCWRPLQCKSVAGHLANASCIWGPFLSLFCLGRPFHTISLHVVVMGSLGLGFFEDLLQHHFNKQ